MLIKHPKNAFINQCKFGRPRLIHCRQMFEGHREYSFPPLRAKVMPGGQGHGESKHGNSSAPIGGRHHQDRPVAVHDAECAKIVLRTLTIDCGMEVSGELAAQRMAVPVRKVSLIGIAKCRLHTFRIVDNLKFGHIRVEFRYFGGTFQT